MCPACGSDDYIVMEEKPNGDPDYDGPKHCETCGEEWYD
jgi:hypothetical protein